MQLKRHKDFIKSEKITESVMQKDLDRMQSILDKSKGDKQKMINYATAMANAITDKHKAFQRGKAADEIIKDQEIGDIFYNRAIELGMDLDINLERSKTGMAKFGMDTPKLGSRLPAPRPEPTAPNRFPYSILPIGSVNIQTGECKYFNVYTTWPDSTAEVWKDQEGNLKLVFTAGEKPLNNIGWRREFKHDQTWKFIGNWEMVEWVRVADLKELLRQFNKKSITGYTYK